MCPGRYLAANQIMIIHLIMMLKYDLVPVQGDWVTSQSHPHITTSVLTPVEDIPIIVNKRREYKKRAWSFVRHGPAFDLKLQPATL